MTDATTSPAREPELVIQTERGERRIKPVSEQSFWDKLQRFAGSAGRNVCEKALWLWYAARDANTPKWARRVAYGAIAYFVLPLDAVPDLIPGVGFSDDLTALAGALSVIAMHVTPEIKAKSEKKLKTWFG